MRGDELASGDFFTLRTLERFQPFHACLKCLDRHPDHLLENLCRGLRRLGEKFLAEQPFLVRVNDRRRLFLLRGGSGQFFNLPSSVFLSLGELVNQLVRRRRFENLFPGAVAEVDLSPVHNLVYWLVLFNEPAFVISLWLVVCRRLFLLVL